MVIIHRRRKSHGPLIQHPYFLLFVVLAVALGSVSILGKLLVSLEHRYLHKLSELLRGDVTRVECTVSTPHNNPPPPNATAATVAAAAAAAGANGVLEITVRNDLSPIASKVFVDLVRAGYYNRVYIFRVIPGFIAQWGYRNQRSWTWSTDTVPTKPPKARDPIGDHTLSNLRGTLSFAGGNPQALQVFVNLDDNLRLDKDKSRPFATLSGSSMEILDKLYMGYRDNMGQVQALKDGTFLERFPYASRVEICQVVSNFRSSSSTTTTTTNFRGETWGQGIVHEIMDELKNPMGIREEEEGPEKTAVVAMPKDDHDTTRNNKQGEPAENIRDPAVSDQEREVPQTDIRNNNSTRTASRIRKARRRRRRHRVR